MFIDLLNFYLKSWLNKGLLLNSNYVPAQKADTKEWGHKNCSVSRVEQQRV